MVREFVVSIDFIDKPPKNKEIVRCKDCKKWFATQNNENGDITKVFCVNGVHEPDWFCADGVMRNDKV